VRKSAHGSAFGLRKRMLCIDAVCTTILINVLGWILGWIQIQRVTGVYTP